MLCLTVGCAAPQLIITDNDTAARLDAVTVPEVDIRAAALSDVVAFLHAGCLPVGYSPPPVRQDVGKTNVTYFIPVPPPTHPSVKIGKQGFWEQPKLVRLGPSVTLSARYISMLKLFEKVTTSSRAKCEVRRDIVVLTVRKVQQPVAPLQKESAPKADPF